MKTTYRIRFFFDYFDVCLWQGNEQTEAAFGTAIQPEKLPLPGETAQRIHKMSDWFDQCLDWSDPGKGIIWSQEECDRFNLDAQQLFEDIKRELGDSFELINEQDVLTPGPD